MAIAQQMFSEAATKRIADPEDSDEDEGHKKKVFPRFLFCSTHHHEICAATVSWSLLAAILVCTEAQGATAKVL